MFYGRADVFKDPRRCEVWKQRWRISGSSYKPSPLSKLGRLISRLPSLVCHQNCAHPRKKHPEGWFPQSVTSLTILNASSLPVTLWNSSIQQRGAVAGDLCPRNLSNHPCGVKSAPCSRCRCVVRDLRQIVWTWAPAFLVFTAWDRAFQGVVKGLGSESDFSLESLSYLLPVVWPSGSFLTSVCFIPWFSNLGNGNSKASLSWVIKAPNAAFVWRKWSLSPSAERGRWGPG